MTATFILRTATAILVAGALSYAAPAKADWYQGQGVRVIIADRDDDNDRDDHHDHWESHHEDDGDDHDHGHHHHHHEEEDHEHGRHHDHDRDREVHLENRDRIIITQYIDHHHHKHCPPGTVKVRRHCIPEGYVSYRVGSTLPPGVEYYALPGTVVRTLTPLPPQDIYVQSGPDVYVMDKTTRTILDAVTLMNDLK